MTQPNQHWTACGLYVINGAHPDELPAYTWHVETAADPNQADPISPALALAQLELRDQIGRHRASGQFHAPADVAFSTLHAGQVERVDADELNFAVPVFRQLAGDRRTYAWTVCGLRRDWVPYHQLVRADTPAAAYVRAKETADGLYGRGLLLCAVHAGDHLPGPGQFRYADPWANSEGEMSLTVETWNVIGG